MLEGSQFTVTMVPLRVVLTLDGEAEVRDKIPAVIDVVSA
jgi:hypothetical protein